MIKYFKVTKYNKTDYKNAEFIDKNGFFEGNSQKNLEKEINYLKKLIDKFIN